MISSLQSLQILVILYGQHQQQNDFNPIVLAITKSYTTYMTWTRLFYVKNIGKAFERVIPGIPREQLAISKRYQAMIRKEFRLAGVPWIHGIKQPAANPRDKRPKTKKKEVQRVIRLAKIQKALKDSDVKEVEYRQQRLNNRKLQGSDALLSRGLPSWIKADLNQIPQYMLRRKGDDGGDD